MRRRLSILVVALLVLLGAGLLAWLALSAAMPGLVGATLRRGGTYAAMRAAITRAAERGAAAAREEPLVRVKLFNLLIDELGPLLLARAGRSVQPFAPREEG